MVKFLLVGLVVVANLVSGFMILTSRRSDDILLAVGIGVLISFIAQVILTFYMWNAIKHEKTTLNPIVATALHFIPIFNILWTLILFSMYPTNYNRYVDSRQEEDKNFSVPYISSQPFNFYIIAFFGSFVLSLIPIVKLFIPFIVLITYIGVIITACNAVENIKTGNLYSVTDESLGIANQGNNLSLS